MRWFGAVLLTTLVGCGSTSVAFREDAVACLPSSAPVSAPVTTVAESTDQARTCPLCGGETSLSHDRDQQLTFHACEPCRLVLTTYPDGATYAAVRRGDRWENYRLVGRGFLPVERDPPAATPVYQETPLQEEALERITGEARRGRTGLWTPRRGTGVWLDRNGRPLPIESVDLTEGLGHPVQLPGHPIWLPGHPIQRPGHPVTRPSHPVTRPNHSISRPNHSIRRPGHSVQRPGHAVNRPNHSVERPGHSVERPASPVTRPTTGPIMFRPGHPVGWTGKPSHVLVVSAGNQEPEPPRASAARVQRREARIARRQARQASRQGGSFSRAAARSGGSFARARR